MRISLVAAAVGLLLVQGAVGAQQAPTFRASTNLVTIDVGVFDGNGRPVPGLDADAFEVTINGRRQPIKVVTYVEARSELAAAVEATTPVRALPTPGGRPGRQRITNADVVEPATAPGEDRVFVILFDDLSIPATRGHRLRQAARKFVDGLPASDPVGVVLTSSSNGAVQPTLDRKAVTDALAKASGSAINPASIQVQGQGGFSPVGVSQAVRIGQGDAGALKDAIAVICFEGDTSAVNSEPLEILIANNQCAARVNRNARIVANQADQVRTNQIDVMRSVITAMSTASGIKHLVILSDGLALGRAVDQFTSVAEAAARAGVQVSVLMEEHDMHVDDQPDTSGTDPGAPRRRLEDQRFVMEGLQTATAMLGGQFYRVVADPDPFFRRVRTASAAVYRLGVELPAGAVVGQPLAIDAKVKSRGLSVFASRHAVVPEPAPDRPVVLKGIDERLTDVLSSGSAKATVPLELATLIRRAPGNVDRVEVTLSVEVPAAAKVRGPVTVMFGFVEGAATTKSGVPINSGRRALDAADDGGFVSTFALPMAPGSYQLRVAVADAEGAMGAVTADLDASLPPLGPFLASDLLVAWMDAKGQPQLMPLESLPAQATGVRAELELYGKGMLPDMSQVQVELLLGKDGDPDVVEERVVTPQQQSGGWRALTEFPTDGLAAGRYTITARVVVGDTVVGTRVATIVRK